MIGMIVLPDKSLGLDMLGASNQSAPDTRDSFYDDDNDNECNNPAPPLISSIRIVTTKPPIYRRESESSGSPSPSSCYSDHDVTDVSSIGGEHHQFARQTTQIQEERKQRTQKRHAFHLQSMRHVLLGSSAPTSRPSTPVNPPSPETNKKHVRIVTENENQKRDHSSRNYQHQVSQPYIHGHHRDHHRVRLTSSAINRQKQQQRIERENLKILERLQQARATQGLKRDELLSNYDRQLSYVTYPTANITPITRSRPPTRPSSAAQMSPTYIIPEKRARQSNRPTSASHSLNSNSVRSRPVSAPTSLHGSSRSSSARRPVWNDRWQQHQE